MKHKLVILMIVLLVVSLSSVYAGNTRRMGTAGAQELLIPYGSRGAALGGAVISDISGVEAMYWNPAGLANVEGTEAMFTHLPYFADININYVGLGTNIEGFGSIGGGAKIVSIGDIEQTDELNPDGTGRTFSPTLAVMNLSYARILTANVTFGFSAMFIHEAVLDVSASGVAFDIGFQYDPRWNGVKLGLAIKNYGPEMKFAGNGFNRELDNRPASPQAAPFDLPSSINIGLSYEFVQDGPHAATLLGNFRSNNYADDYYGGGFEYSYENTYFLRGGYNFSEQDNYLYGACFGAGVKYKFGDTRIGFEYTWTETDVFDNNQYFTVTLGF